MKKPIVFICQRVPYPPDRGDRIATFNIIKHLSKKHSVHLFCLTSDRKDLKKKEKLSEFCEEINIYYQKAYKVYIQVIRTLLFSKEPLSNAYYSSRQMKEGIEKTIKKYDIKIAYAYSSNVYQYVSKIKNIKKIFHLADVDSEKWRKLAKKGSKALRFLYKLEATRLRDWEINSAREADYSILCTEEEKKLFISIGAEGRIEVVKNGVDTDYFTNLKNVEKEQAIIFTGVMDYYPNIDTVLYFCRDVLPLVEEELPDIKFYIVGSRPTKEIKDLSKEDNNCIVTGYVEDVRPYLSKAMAAVVPMRLAQGIQNKILEALAMELPVVTNSQMIKVLSLDGEKHGIIRADEPRTIADAIIDLIKNPERCVELGKKGRRAAVEHYSWEKNLEKIDKILNA